MSSHARIFAAGLAFVAVTSTLPADTIKLEGGGVVRGQILEDKSTDDLVVVKSRGGEVTIERSKIKEIVKDKADTQGTGALAEYEKIKDQYADSAEDQYKLALWCEEHKLYRQRREHLERVIELDPEHASAHEKLGHVRHEGKWLTRNEQKEARGYVRFQGRYVTPQEKELLEQKKVQDDKVREWHLKVRMWKNWLTGTDTGKQKQGEEALRAVDDPLALDAVVGQFGKENDESLRILMCELVGNLSGEEATIELVKRAIIDVSGEVRWAAIDALVAREDPLAVKSFVRALESDHNTVIRRAGEALGALGDPSAVPALIGALVSKHKQVVTQQVQTGGFGATSVPTIVDYEAVVANGAVAYRPIIAMQASGAGISSPRQEVVIVPVENDEVLEALRLITKEDYGFNQTAWRQWYAGELRREELKKRRRIEDR